MPSNDVGSGLDRHSRTSSVSSYGSGHAFHIDDSIEEEREGFLSRYHHGNGRSLAELNNSDSNSSTEDSHSRRVALMMASPGQPPRSNSSREKQRRRTRPSSRRTTGEIQDNVSPNANRRRLPKLTVSPSHKRRLSSDKSHVSEYSTTEMSSESSPDTSPIRHVSDMHRLEQSDLSPYTIIKSSSGLSFSGHRKTQSSSSLTDQSYDPKSTARKSPTKNRPPPRDFKSVRTKSSTSNKYFSLSTSFFGIILISIVGMITLTSRVTPPTDKQFDEGLFNRPTVRGKQVLLEQLRTSDSEKIRNGKLKSLKSKHAEDVKSIRHSSSSNGNKSQPKNTVTAHDRLQMRIPPSLPLEEKPEFEFNDRKIYSHSKRSEDTDESNFHPRTVMLDAAVKKISRKIEIYPADFTDNTQLYGLLESEDERLNRMEIREPYSKGECVPMQEWQTAYQPSCNGMHELALQTLGQTSDTSRNTGEPEGLDATLFGTKGFWRYAWKLVIGRHDEREAEEDTIVFKNLK